MDQEDWDRWAGSPGFIGRGRMGPFKKRERQSVCVGAGGGGDLAHL